MQRTRIVDALVGWMRELTAAVAVLVVSVLAVSPAPAQQVEWTQLDLLSPRSNHAMAYDSTRAVTVLFGGFTGSVNGETWEWNGTAWTQRMVNGPAPQEGPAMAYDAARRLTVLFGGYNLAETWEWNGVAWRHQPIFGPSRREYASMTCDAVHNEILLFGGSVAGGNPRGETWRLGVPCSAPAITDQPADQFVGMAGSASFSIQTSEPASSYQWRRNEVALTNSTRISGATGDTRIIAGVQSSDLGNYDCIVTGVCGTVTSNPAPLSCRVVFAEQPAGGDFGAGDTVVLSARIVPGSGATFRWRRDGANLFNGLLFSGVNTSTLTINAADPTLAGGYTLAATNGCGVAVSSPAVVNITCRGDYNNDGGIDGAGVETFFAAWEAGGC